MLKFEKDYADLLVRINGAALRQTRNAVTRAIFGQSLVVEELRAGVFPVIQGRKMFPKGVIGEMAAFLHSPKTVEDFKSRGCNYWDEWGDEDGNLILDYGNAWTDFNGVNQLEEVCERLVGDQHDRRHIISAWRPDRLKKLSLPCCHYAYQWFVDCGELEMIWIQRSVDSMIGLPSDIVLAALFNILMAQTVGLKPGRVTMQLGDTHIYELHQPGVEIYLDQAYKLGRYFPFPTWKLDPAATVFNFEPEMFSIENYLHAPPIKMDLLV